MSKWKYGRMGNYKAKGQSAQDEWNANVPDSWNGYAPSNYDSFSPPQQSNDIPYDSFSPPPPKTDKGVPLNRQDSYSPPQQGNDIPYDSYSSPPSQPSTPKITRGQAFQNARELGKKEFTYEGKKYHTRTKEEEDGLSAIPDENFNMMGYS